MNEAMNLLESRDFIDSLYGFAYNRTSSLYEAEDLCSDIILTVLKAIKNNSAITNPHAFIWTVVHRVYADFSKKRRNYTENHIADEYSDEVINICNNPIDEYIENDNDNTQIKSIMREISFLSKLYRDVCVMYYLDELKISEIAVRLNMSENAVKQRLHFSRNAIKKGVEKMNTANLTLKPIDLAYIGTGNPVGNDPIDVAKRSFSKNLVYLCKDTERSGKELSELLNVPMPFVEEEIEIQLKGQNGYYGLLQKTENGKYISNFIIVDYEDYMKVNEMYKNNTDIIASRFDAFLKKNEQKILDMPFLNKQTDIRFIAWSLISRVNWWFSGNVTDLVEEKYFKDITKTKREFYTFGIATTENQVFDIGFYGCDGITANNICGYNEVFMSNIYGRRVQKHFGCGHNISQDPQLLLLIKSINGLALSSLSEKDNEIAAKAIESGYIKKDGDLLYPKILVTDSEKPYRDIMNDFIVQTDDLIEPVADEVYKFIKKFVPKHLIGEWHLFVQQTSCGLLNAMIEKCIEIGTLVPPERTPGAEGVIMVVKK